MFSFADLFRAFEKYFNEIVGVVAPGGFLLIGLDYLGVLAFARINLQAESAGALFILIIGAYIVGLAVNQLSGVINHGNPSETWSSVRFRMWVEKQAAAKGLLFSTFDEKDRDGLSRDNVLRMTLSVQRSMAMTISETGEELARRFKFMELLCRGICFDLCVLIVIGTCMAVYRYAIEEPIPAAWLWAAVFSIVIALGLWPAACKFKSLTETVAFQTSLVEILK